MQIKYDDLADHLQRGVKPLYVVHGDEPLLTLEAGDAIRAAARAVGASERDVLVVEPGFKWDAFLGANANGSLFGDRRFVDLRIPSGKPGVEGGKALEGYAANPNPDNVTLVTLPRVDRATQASAWFSALADAGVTVAVYPVERDAPTLAVWQLSEDVHALAAVVTLMRSGTPASAAVRTARVWGKRQSALERAVQRVAPSEIATLLAATARLDALSKGIGRGNPWDELESTALALAGKPVQTAPIAAALR